MAVRAKISSDISQVVGSWVVGGESRAKAKGADAESSASALLSAKLPRGGIGSNRLTEVSLCARTYGALGGGGGAGGREECHCGCDAVLQPKNWANMLCVPSFSSSGIDQPAQLDSRGCAPVLRVGRLGSGGATSPKRPARPVLAKRASWPSGCATTKSDSKGEQSRLGKMMSQRARRRHPGVQLALRHRAWSCLRVRWPMLPP